MVEELYKWVEINRASATETRLTFGMPDSSKRAVIIDDAWAHGSDLVNIGNAVVKGYLDEIRRDGWGDNAGT